jgi:hypothetical protein
MSIDLHDLLSAILAHPFCIAYFLGQLFVVRVRSRTSARGVGGECSSSNSTYFLPVLVWGIESAFHAHRVLFGPSRYCFGVPLWVFASQAALSGTIGAGLVAGGFLSERWARRTGRLARQAQATLPLPVVAALVSVQLTWSMHLSAYLPVR